MPGLELSSANWMNWTTARPEQTKTLFDWIWCGFFVKYYLWLHLVCVCTRVGFVGCGGVGITLYHARMCVYTGVRVFVCECVHARPSSFPFDSVSTVDDDDDLRECENSSWLFKRIFQLRAEIPQLNCRQCRFRHWGREIRGPLRFHLDSRSVSCFVFSFINANETSNTDFDI